MSFEQIYSFAIGIGVGFGVAALWVLSSLMEETTGDCQMHKGQSECAHRPKKR